MIEAQTLPPRTSQTKDLVVTGVGVALVLAIAGMILRVPHGWWPITPVGYVPVLVGLALAPAMRHHRVIVFGIAAVSGALGIVSFLSILAGGLIADPMPDSVERVVLVLGSAFLLMVLLLAVVAGWEQTKRGRATRPGLVRLAYVVLATIAIGLLQGAWVARVYFS